MNDMVESVWTDFHPRLQRFVYNRVPDPQAADDVLQEVYLKIHTHIDSLRDSDRMQAWLYQITRNTIHDYYRSQRPLDEISDDIAAPELPDPTDDIMTQLTESIRSMIYFLPDEYREALILTEIEGLTQKELAERLGISVSGAKSRVQRGRRQLRALLHACCQFQFDRHGAVIDYYPHDRCCSG